MEQVTHILFELQPIMIFSPVANYGNRPLFKSSGTLNCFKNSISYKKQPLKTKELGALIITP